MALCIFCYFICPLFIFNLFLLNSFFTAADPGANDVILMMGMDNILHSTPLEIYLNSAIQMELLKGRTMPTMELHLPGHRPIGMDLTDFDGIEERRRGHHRRRQAPNVPSILSRRHGIRHWLSGLKLTLDKGDKIEAKIRLSINQLDLPMSPPSVFEIPLNLFVWNWTDKLVISDIDGTITRMDMMEIILPMLDWKQTGVDILYTKIAAQGYKLVYLTARPLSMANQTQNYLTQIGLPDGPILLWPNKMLKKGGLILGNPAEYKANCLLGIQRIFPPDSLPFRAGFGNAETDKFAYEQLKIPYIFMINPEGEVKVYHRGRKMDKKRDNGQKGKDLVVVPLDYTTIADNLELFFPKTR